VLTYPALAVLSIGYRSLGSCPAWEAALVNSLSPGDRVLMVETGHFVDITVGGAQKGLMLPPGMAFNAVSDKAIAASKDARCPKSFWSWEDKAAGVPQYVRVDGAETRQWAKPN
jgi:aspartate aminotransferase-like enzyme